MASLRFLLGMLPTTAKYENASDKLRKDYIEFKKFESSDELKHYESLEYEVSLSDFHQKIKNLKSLKYKGSNEYHQEKEYLKLIKSKVFKKYQKLLNLRPAEDTDNYRELKNLENSWEVKKIQELEKMIKSDSFQETKRYLSLSAKDRFERSEEFKKQQEYKQLRTSAKITWYKSLKKKYPFKEVEQWDLIFEDKFEDSKLNDRIWMTRYLSADKILKKGYVFPDDRHAFAEGKNIELFTKKLRIITRREKAKSLVWSPAFGFYEKEFEYTSDLINSANGFTGRYGIFEAKIRPADSGVTQAFSLMTDKILPHIDVVRFEKGKLFAGNFWNGNANVNKSVSSTSGKKFCKDFFIYSLEWQPGMLTWKVNGQVFKIQKTGVPENEMFMVFSSSLKEHAKETGIPSNFEIDWVRVYKKKE